jgi:tetratricopeptide (TPR) repeat protein
MPDPFSLPNWRDIALHPGVLRESALGDNRRLVVWLPVERDRNCQHWHRVSVVPYAEVIEHEGLSSVAATMIRARQQVRGVFHALLSRFRRGAGGNTWQLPNGNEAKQEGARRTDLVLVWSDEGHPLDESRIREQWPQSTEVQSLGPRLFLVSGVVVVQDQRVAEPPLPEQSSQEQAEQQLVEARRSGDKAQEVSALADMGLLNLDEGRLPQAIAHLEQALTLAQSLGDQGREGDVQGILGLVRMKDGQPKQARWHLEQALILARAAGDPLTEKLALERLATVCAFEGDSTAALGLLANAITLARTLGDRQHEAELLWHTAILQAEAGRREHALDCGQQAVEMLQTLGRPQARVYAEHLLQYRRGQTDTVSPEGASQIGSPAAPNQTGPSYLRMAISAAQALGQFVGSGLKTVPAETTRARLQRCGACSHYTGMRCRVCGCFVHLKARLPHEDCPLGLWPKLPS